MADSGLSALYINLFHSCGNLMRGCPSVCSHYRWGNWDREWKIMYSVLSTCECWSCDWHGGSLTSEFTPPNPSPMLPPGTSFLEHPSHWLPRFFSSFSNQASLCRPGSSSSASPFYPGLSGALPRLASHAEHSHQGISSGLRYLITSQGQVTSRCVSRALSASPGFRPRHSAAS